MPLSDSDSGSAVDASRARCEAEAAAVVEHVRKLLCEPRLPAVTPELEALPGFVEMHDYLAEVRTLLASDIKGDFSLEVKRKGVVAGMLKSLQANMQHLAWQMNQVCRGDFSQRVDFMGEFSTAFNTMVAQLNDALSRLRAKEEELTAIADTLREEVEKRGAALSALKKSEEKLKYLAAHDPLTGLLNRRSFFARAEVEAARSSMTGEYCSICLLDLDKFKRFNDTYGHQAGDAALRHVAIVGAGVLRDTDIFGRYGGEEFIVFLPKSNLEQAEGAAERIRRLVEETPLTYGGEKLSLTASIGVTAMPPNAKLLGELNVMEFAVGLADSALYQAKSQGRNRVCAREFPEVE